MATKVHNQALDWGWLHSNKEDTDDEIVYRRANYSFPPALAPRNSFQFEPDCRLLTSEPTAFEKASKKMEIGIKQQRRHNRFPQSVITKQITAPADKDKLVSKKWQFAQTSWKDSNLRRQGIRT